MGFGVGLGVLWGFGVAFGFGVAICDVWGFGVAAIATLVNRNDATANDASAFFNVSTSFPNRLFPAT